MIRGFYTSVSGLISNIARQSVVADNIANVNTTGFKEARTGQSSFQLALGGGVAGALGSLGTGAYATGPAVTTQIAGSLEPTGNLTDLAIQGDGLFVVAHDGGFALTRAGDFVVDANGTLTTQAGEPVLAVDGQPITLPAGANGFTVGPDGTIQGTGQRLAVVGWPAAGVVRLGGNLYASADATPLNLSGTAQVIQGMLERSNVDLGRAMTELISFQRALGMNARALSLQDETLGEAVQLGRPR